MFIAAPPNQSPKPTLESIAALRGSVSGSAAWLKRSVSGRNEPLLMFSEQRIEQERENTSGQPINKTSTNVDGWVKSVFPDRDLVTAEELASYGYSIKRFDIAVSGESLL